MDFKGPLYSNAKHSPTFLCSITAGLEHDLQAFQRAAGLEEVLLLLGWHVSEWPLPSRGSSISKSRTLTTADDPRRTAGHLPQLLLDAKRILERTQLRKGALGPHVGQTPFMEMVPGFGEWGLTLIA